MNLLEYFEKKRSEENCNYLGVYCEVDYPEQSDIAFNIHSFGEENPSPDQTSKWVKTGQVDAFCDFRTYGIIDYPDDLKQLKCEVMINPLSSTDRFDLNPKGIIGDGWFENDSFLLRIWLSLEATNGLLQQMERKKIVDPRKFRIRFDLIGLAARKNAVSYSICRVYC